MAAMLLLKESGNSDAEGALDVWMNSLFFSFATEYICHESGAAAVAYSPNRQCIVSGGRKGDICIPPYLIGCRLETAVKVGSH